MTGKERILSADRNRANGAFNGVVIHLDTAIFEEQDKPVPIAGNVFQRAACRRFGRDLLAGIIKPDLESLYEGFAFFLTSPQTRVSCLPAYLLFNPVEFGNLLEPLLCNRRGAGDCQIV